MRKGARVRRDGCLCVMRICNGMLVPGAGPSGPPVPHSLMSHRTQLSLFYLDLLKVPALQKFTSSATSSGTAPSDLPESAGRGVRQGEERYPAARTLCQALQSTALPQVALPPRSSSGSQCGVQFLKQTEIDFSPAYWSKFPTIYIGILSCGLEKTRKY